MEVQRRDGKRGGEYFFVDLADGRRVAISRKAGDNRVWVGREDDLASWDGQRGGVGTLPKMLADAMAQVALDPAAKEMYFALRALEAAKA